MKKALALVLSLSMMVTMLAACGGNDDTTSSNTSTDSSTSSNTAPTITGDNVVAPEDVVVDTDAEPEGVQLGTSVAVASGVDFVTQLLPNTFNGGRWFYNQVYDALFWDQNNDGIGGDPLLVDTYTASDDLLTWELNLHEDVYFHNGNKLTAESVIGSIDFLIEYDLVTATDSLVSYEATGEYQVKFVLSTVGPETPDFMGIYIFDHTSYLEHGYGVDAAIGAGSGPYEIVSYALGDSINIKAVENHWNPNRQAHIDEVTVKIITNTSTAFNALAAGDLDYGVLGEYSYYEQLVNSDDHLIVTLDAAPNVIWMNAQGFSEHLANPVVREALSMMVSSEEVMLAATGGYGSTAENILNHAFTGYTQNRVYDPEAGLALLESEGINPADIVLTAIVDNGRVIPYTNIQSQLMDCGITLEFVATDMNVVMTAGTAGEWDLWSDIGGLEAAPVYSGSIRNIMAHTAAQKVITDPDLRLYIGDLVTDIFATTDYDEFLSIVAEICQLCDENYLYLCNWIGVSWNGFSSDVENPVIDSSCGQWRIYESWIAE